MYFKHIKVKKITNSRKFLDSSTENYCLIKSLSIAFDKCDIKTLKIDKNGHMSDFGKKIVAGLHKGKML